MTHLDADLAVVGLGAIGAATAHRAAAAGLSVVGFDRFSPPHELGSSHAETRITRLAAGEGPEYLATVARSHEIWRELERETGTDLLHQCGGLIIGPSSGGGADGRWTDFVSATAAVADTAGVEFERLEAPDVRARWPRIRVGDGNVAGLERSAGIVMVERAVAVQLALARELGARIHTNEAVLTIDPDDTGVNVTTPQRTIRVARVVTAAGAWLPEFLTDADEALVEVTRQVVFWFDVDDLDAFAVGRLPTLIWAGEEISDYIGVFPIAAGTTPALKVLGEQFDRTTTADAVDRTVSESEIAEFHERLVVPRLDGVTPNCVRAAVCLYTNTPTDDFLIDTDPRSDRIMIVSPCSGHGFKHSAAIGEALAHAAAGIDPFVDLGPFSRRRFVDR